MAAGKHIGKVLIKIRDEEEDKHVRPVHRTIEAAPRFHCEPEASYIIAGAFRFRLWLLHKQYLELRTYYYCI